MTEKPDPRRALVLASAAWAQLHGITQTYQAAVMRGDLDEAERLRQEAHDVLDGNLDLNAQAAHLTRALLEG